MNVGRFVNDNGALSTKFKGDWCEVVGSSGHHNAANGAVASVEDVIKVLGEQCSCFGHSAFNKSDGLLVEILRYESCENF